MKMKEENNFMYIKLIKSEQLSEVKVKEHTPEGLFTKSGETIASTLLSEAKGDPGVAMKKLIFYMNRVGKNISNKIELNKAKKILHEKVEKQEEK